MLKSKLHRATVTQADLHYEGSISIDRALLKAAGIWPNEQVDVYNLSNGNRFTTYAIEGGEGEICINGAAAHLTQPGDQVIIVSYVQIAEADLSNYRPNVILLDERNQPK